MTTRSPRQIELIEAAGKILTTSGVAGLTTKKLAKEMQFSESAIYRHFSSKEEIVCALLDYLSETLDTLLKERVNSSETPIQQFRALFECRFSYFNAHPNFVVAVFSDGLMDGSEQINQAIARLMSVTSGQLKTIVEKGQEQGVFTTDISAEMLIHISMGTFRLHMLKWRTSGFKNDFSENGKTLLNSLLKLITI